MNNVSGSKHPTDSALKCQYHNFVEASNSNIKLRKLEVDETKSNIFDSQKSGNLFGWNTFLISSRDLMFTHLKLLIIYIYGLNF